MFDLATIEGFDWDEGNARKSLEKHNATQAEAEQVFSSQPMIAEDIRHSAQEARFQALGVTNEGRGLHVTFTLRDNGRRIRVISARDMSRKERAVHEQAT